jgi:hypothetical protein
VITSPATSFNVGFLTIVQEASGLVGGYLVTNQWGRPLEFRLSTAVQPNRVQQILYAGTLQPYLCGDLIGKTLVEKTATPVRLVVTDRQDALDLRLRFESPVVWLAPSEETSGLVVRSAEGNAPAVICHSRFPADVEATRELLGTIADLDLTEPFLRIREAMTEARKMGVTQRN